MSTDSKSNGLIRQEGAKALCLSKDGDIDISGLPVEQQNALIAKQAELRLSLQHKASEALIDAQMLDTRLKTMAAQAKEADKTGASVTITNVKEDSMGRTEVLMGNSETAHRGKLSTSQQGRKGGLFGWLFGN